MAYVLSFFSLQYQTPFLLYKYCFDVVKFTGFLMTWLICGYHFVGKTSDKGCKALFFNHSIIEHKLAYPLALPHHENKSV